MAREDDVKIKESAFLALIAGKADSDPDWARTVQKRWKDYYLSLLGCTDEEKEKDQDLMEQYEQIKNLRPVMERVDGKAVIKGIF